MSSLSHGLVDDGLYSFSGDIKGFDEDIRGAFNLNGDKCTFINGIGIDCNFMLIICYNILNP